MRISRDREGRTSCPSRDELAAFHSGRLPSITTEALGKHLTECDRCQEAMERLETEADWFVQDLQDSMSRPPFEEAECERVVAAVVSLHETSRAGTARSPDAPLGDAGRKKEALCVRCPYCRYRIELGNEDPLRALHCPQCGTEFRLAAHETSPGDSESAWCLGQYRLVEQVGMGRFGGMWKARDEGSGAVVAVKVPRRGDLSRDEIGQFLREAQAASQIEHPNIVRTIEVGRKDDLIYIVSEFVDGLNLKDWLTDQPLAPREAAAMCRTVAEALAAAHAAGVVHRDLKPANLMIDRDGNPHITDFGLAKRDRGDVTVTVEGHILGTPAYMSPEQARGRGHEADSRSDIYALGVIFFELLTGQPPFRGDARMLVSQILWEEPPRPCRLNDRIPRPLETICLKCLEKPPGRRYQTATELADDLQRYLSKETVRARPASSATRLWRWSRRRPAVAVLSLTLMLLTVVATTAIAIAYARTASSLKTARRNLYYTGIAAAQESLESNAVALARTALADCPSEARRFEWKYLERACEPEQFVFPGTGEPIAYHPDGSQLATASGAKNELWLWNVASGEKHLAIGGNSGRLEVMAYRDDGNIVAVSATGSRSILLWDVANQSVFRTLDHRGAEVVDVAFAPGGGRLFSLGTDRKVRIWDVETQQTVHRYTASGPHPRSMAVDPEGRRVAVSYGANKLSRIQIVDLSSGAFLESPAAGGRTVTSLAFSPDGELLAVGEASGFVRLWALDPPRQVAAIPVATAAHSSVTFDPVGERIAFAAWDFTVRVWSVQRNSELHVLRGHDAPPRQIRFSPDGRQVASSSLNDTVRVWLLDRSAAHQCLRGEQVEVTDLAFDGSGRRLASSGTDGTVKLWDVASGEPLGTLACYDKSVYAVAFSHAGHSLVVGGRAGLVELWDVAAREVRQRLEGHDLLLRSVTFSHDDRLIASAGRGGEAHVWDARTGDIVWTHAPGDVAFRRAAFSPDGALLALGTYAGTIEVIELASGTSCWTTETSDLAIWDLDWNPALPILGVIYANGTIEYRDSQTGELIVATGGIAHKRPSRLAFSPDGARLLSAVTGRAAALWEVPSGRHVLDICRCPEVGGAAAFSPTGSCIATADRDGNVHLWRSE